MSGTRPRFPPTSRHNVDSLASNAAYTVPAHLLRAAAAPAPADEWRVDATLERLVDRFGFVAEAEAPLPAAELVRLENRRLLKLSLIHI